MTAPSANRSLIPTVVAVSLVLRTAKVNARSSSRITLTPAARVENGTVRTAIVVEVEWASEETFGAVAICEGIGVLFQRIDFPEEDFDILIHFVSESDLR